MIAILSVSEINRMIRTAHASGRRLWMKGSYEGEMVFARRQDPGNLEIFLKEIQRWVPFNPESDSFTLMY